MKSTHQFVDPDTKATIARVAAEYALYEGLDSVTPAAVAEGAGPLWRISTRATAPSRKRSRTSSSPASSAWINAL